LQAPHAMVPRESSRLRPTRGDRDDLGWASAPILLAGRPTAAEADLPVPAGRIGVPLAAWDPLGFAAPQGTSLPPRRDGRRTSGRLRAGGVLDGHLRRQF